MNMRPLVLLSVLAMGLLTACQNTVNSVENAEKTAVVAPIAEKRVVTDHFLKRRLVWQGVKTSYTTDGVLMVEVSVLNNRTGFFSELWSRWNNENPYPVDYKFTWKDANGMTVETPLSIWKTVRIHPGESYFFHAVAPTAACKDFVLSLKESSNKLR